MSQTPSQMITLGIPAPDFNLPSTEGKNYTLNDFQDKKVLVVIFMCNHCPYVQHMRQKLAEVAKAYQEKNVAFVGINSNDFNAYPDDNMEAMVLAAKEFGFTFPYLLDESQEVAKAYGAACTPDIFVFDGDRKLVYRGQFDASRPSNDIPITGNDLTKVLDFVIDDKEVPTDQKPSIGCNIKWRPGNEPEYFD